MSNKNNLMFVSFVIQGHKDFKDLSISLSRFGINHHFHVLNDKSGNKFGFSQAEYLCKMLDHHPRQSVVWLDPDLVLCRYPHQFGVQTTPIAIYSHDITTALDTSVIYLANTAPARQLMQMWVDANAKNPDRFESENLRQALRIWHVRNVGGVGRLPETYAPKLKHVHDPVIIHKDQHAKNNISSR